MDSQIQGPSSTCLWWEWTEWKLFWLMFDVLCPSLMTFFKLRSSPSFQCGVDQHQKTCSTGNDPGHHPFLRCSKPVPRCRFRHAFEYGVLSIAHTRLITGCGQHLLIQDGSHWKPLKATGSPGNQGKTQAVWCTLRLFFGLWGHNPCWASFIASSRGPTAWERRPARLLGAAKVSEHYEPIPEIYSEDLAKVTCLTMRQPPNGSKWPTLTHS